MFSIIIFVNKHILNNNIIYYYMASTRNNNMRSDYRLQQHQFEKTRNYMNSFSGMASSSYGLFYGSLLLYAKLFFK